MAWFVELQVSATMLVTLLVFLSFVDFLINKLYLVSFVSNNNRGNRFSHGVIRLVISVGKDVGYIVGFLTNSEPVHKILVPIAYAQSLYERAWENI